MQLKFLFLIFSFVKNVETFSLEGVYTAIDNVAKVVEFLNEPESDNFNHLKEDIIDSIKSHVTSTSALQTTIILDHHFETHVQFPIKNLVYSVVNYLENPSNLSKTQLIQDCRHYRPNRILTHLDEMLKNTTNSWLSRYFKTIRYKSHEVENISINTIKLLQMLIWSNGFCLTTNPDFDLNTFEIKQELKNFVTLIEKAQKSIENHVLHATRHYFQTNVIRELMVENWQLILEHWPLIPKFQKCSVAYRLANLDDVYCTRYYNYIAIPLYVLLVKNYGGYNDLFTLWIQEAGPFSGQPSWHQENSVHYVASEPHNFMHFKIDEYRIFIYRSLRSSNTAFINYKNQTDGNKRKHCLGNKIDYFHPCHDLKFCGLFWSDGYHSSLIQKEEILKFESKVNFCNEYLFEPAFDVVFGLSKNHDKEKRGQDLIRKLRKKWINFQKSNNTALFDKNLTTKFEEGIILKIHGRVYEDAEHFHVDLIGRNQSGDSSIQNVALRFESRFNESKNVVNSFINGEWGSEEHALLGLKPGQEFNLHIFFLKNKLVTDLEKSERIDYTYRVPANIINQLLIDGDVILYKILYGGKSLTVPYEKEFPDGHFGINQQIFIHGLPSKKHFQINFLNENDDILFHFNPRYHENVVVRNSMINKNWGKEERDGIFPFTSSYGTLDHFDLVLINKNSSIEIHVNNRLFANFVHRTENPELDYKKIFITGSLSFLRIYIGDGLFFQSF